MGAHSSAKFIRENSFKHTKPKATRGWAKGDLTPGPRHTEANMAKFRAVTPKRHLKRCCVI